MKKKLIFRADGNSDTGLGHLYRLFALVEMLKDDYSFTFISSNSSTISVIPKSYSIELIPKKISINDEPIWIVNKFNPKEYIIIADGYHFISSYQKHLKSLGFSLIYIDDLYNEYMYADIVINHSPNLDKSIYKAKDYTKFALGTKYALLRPLFLKEAAKNLKEEKIDTAFVCFGGSDKYNLSFIATQALLEKDIFKTIYVVLGAAYEHKEIFNLLDNNKVKIVRNASETEMVKIMKQSNFAISPASTILYELCCVKMPILSGYYVENQKNIYKQLIKSNTIYKGGDFSKYSKLEFTVKINEIINDKNRFEMLKQQKKLFDGRNKNRILGLVNSLNISFIKASEEHVKQIYDWSNDKLVRRHSYNRAKIEYDNHVSWFNKKIRNNQVLFLIILINNTPSGIVRFEIDNKETTIGILISKKYRGQSLAVDVLKKATNKYFLKYHYPIFAYIKKTNIASVKSFEGAGYMLYKEEVVSSINSFIYKIEKKNV
ncbi:MAG TPA: UDP-2,4-diacetamido-2,4,6-trideoxy-beta-L-altropyranose hydrolase [Flavobacteriaceae bacterium]|nr:UDP-2,4-diacetamido-2,4,6-trideoxy-beta-L-altropyranose hydrolase [Flavobacteriaceae bacterium]